MDSIKLWARHGEVMCQAIELGDLVHMETAAKLDRGHAAGMKTLQDNIFIAAYRSPDLACAARENKHHA